MLDDLVGVIETLKTRIQDHRADLQASETRTRMALIDPLLTALGWDTSDPRLVTPEYASNGRADYALSSPDGPPAALVEAKKLGEAVEPHRMQMLNYSNASGVAFAGLTDGSHWELYDVFRKDTLDKRRVLELSISDTPAHKCALELLLLWRPNLASGEPIKANEPISPASTTPSTPAMQTINIQQPPTPTNNEGWTSLSGFQPGTNGESPSRVRLPDDEERPIQGWRYILMEVAEWLIRTEKLTSDKVPLASGRTRYLIHNETKHSNGTDFKSPMQLSSGLFLEGNVSAKEAVKTTRFLLEHFGEDAATVSLKFN